MRMLDLFCGGGLAGMGYWLSGRFAEVVGVDCGDMSGVYPFDFIRQDAMTLTYDFLMDFDFIHASPPCQGYSYNTENDGRERPRLVAGTRLMLAAAGVPHVVENVQGAVKELRPNLSMDGHSVGVSLERRRYFYVSTLQQSTQLMSSGDTVNVHSRDFIPRSEVMAAFGLFPELMSARWLSNLAVHHVIEGIPPAMTKRIAEMMFPNKFMIGCQVTHK